MDVGCRVVSSSSNGLRCGGGKAFDAQRGVSSAE